MFSCIGIQKANENNNDLLSTLSNTFFKENTLGYARCGEIIFSFGTSLLTWRILPLGE